MSAVSREHFAIFAHLELVNWPVKLSYNLFIINICLLLRDLEANLVQVLSF